MPPSKLSTTAWFALLTLSACSGEGTRFVELPPRTAAIQSAITVFEYPDRMAVHAGDPTGPFRDAEQELERITLLYYASELSELGLSAGPVPQAAPNFCAAYPLPPAEATWSLTPDAQSFQEDSLSPAAADFRFMGPCPCTDFDSNFVELDFDDTIRALFQISEGRFLVLSGRELIEFTEAGVRARYPSSQPLTSGHQGPDGTIWVGSRQGQLQRWTPQSGFVHTASSASGGRIDKLYHVGEQLFAIDADNQLMRLDEQTLSVVQEFEMPSDDISDFGIFEDGTLLLGDSISGGYLHYQAGRPSTYIPMDSQVGNFVALERVDRYEVLGSTSKGRVFEIDRAGQARLLSLGEGRGDTQRLRAFTAFGDGFLAFGHTGVYIQYTPSLGLCPGKVLDLNFNLSAALATSDATIVIGKIRQTSPARMGNRAFFLRPRER